MAHKETGGSRSRPAASVLIVDDNVDQADSLAALCRVLGHEVQVAYDGESALRTARGCHPGIVFLDITLPGMDGYDVASRLRAELGSTVRLVAVSGRGRDEDRARPRRGLRPFHPQAARSRLPGKPARLKG